MVLGILPLKLVIGRSHRTQELIGIIAFSLKKFLKLTEKIKYEQELLAA